MSEPKHTPGPWHTNDPANVKAGPHLVALVFGHSREFDDFAVECKANARLIAAAPELLAACERAVEYLTDDEEMLSAIAKAKGETA